VLGLDALELDGNLLSGNDVGSQVDIAEGAGANLPPNPVLVADSEILQA
jgi:hypothetical protein